MQSPFTERKIIATLFAFSGLLTISSCAPKESTPIIAPIPPTLSETQSKEKLKTEKTTRAYELIEQYRQITQQPNPSWTLIVEIVPSTHLEITGHPNTLATAAGKTIYLDEKLLYDPTFDSTVLHEIPHLDINQIRLISSSEIKTLNQGLISLDSEFIKDSIVMGFDLDLTNKNNTQRIRATASLEEASADLIMIYTGEKIGSRIVPTYGKTGQFLRYLNKKANLSDLDFIKFHRESDIFGYNQKVLRMNKKPTLAEIKVFDLILAKMINGGYQGTDQNIFEAAEKQLFTILDNRTIPDDLRTKFEISPASLIVYIRPPLYNLFRS